MSSAGPSEVLPDKGLVFSEPEDLGEVMCKPKILPIKSFSLERLERLEKKMQEEQKLRREREKAEKKAGGWSSGGPAGVQGMTPPALVVPARAARPGPSLPLAPAPSAQQAVGERVRDSANAHGDAPASPQDGAATG